jgi:hypothetical protein
VRASLEIEQLSLFSIVLYNERLYAPFLVARKRRRDYPEKNIKIAAFVRFCILDSECRAVFSVQYRGKR